MSHERMELLEQVMALGFTLLELNLFLDTHPDDKKALQKFQEALVSYNSVRKQYVEKYGPLIYTDLTSTKSWEWINEPWPWQLSK